MVANALSQNRSPSLVECNEATIGQGDSSVEEQVHELGITEKGDGLVSIELRPTSIEEIKAN